MRKRLRLLVLIVGMLVLAYVVAVQYVILLNYTGPPPGPKFTLGDYLEAIARSIVSVWTLGTVAIIALLYRLIGSGASR